ncbi:hypothetical protein [Micromonospora sp. NPDC005710]|uniref:hypothetical protein n=1 Tax=Micromonospora sp. NPDC005710 TaxID=3157051 RepID=UPI0033FA3F63
MSDGDLISELYAGCFRRLVVQLYAVTGDLTEAARLLVSRDDGRHFTVAREYGRLVGSVSVGPGNAWMRFSLAP